MKIFLRIFVFLIITLPINLVGQSVVFTYDQYIDQVRKHHPIMYRIDLMEENAAAVETVARGAFDPKIEADYNNKSFDDKNYYSLLSGGLKVPTWYGIEAKAGYERNNGEFLSSSDILPEFGLWSAGISIPLGKNLVIDERRAELKKAKIFQNSTEQEQIILRNGLIFQASKAYLDWQYAFQLTQIAQEGVRLAEIRLRNTILSFENGDVPAIDTLEATISLQNREIALTNAEINLVKTINKLQVFLWIDGFVPLEMEDNLVPEELKGMQFIEETLLLEGSIEQVVASHPELQIYTFKNESLEVDKALGKEGLKPDLRLNFQPLVTAGSNGGFQSFSANDYKIGGSFYYPILQRKERGKLKMIDVKQREVVADAAQKGQEIRTKLRMLTQNNNQLQEVFATQSESVINTKLLLDAENLKFSIGESSIFLLNSRESKYLEARMKVIDILRKIIGNRIELLYVAANFEV